MPVQTAAARRPEFLQTTLPDAAQLRAELAHGLLRRPASVASKFFYDALGSRLFEAITLLDEYPATRAEAAIFEQHLPAIAEACGPGHTLVDLGAGNCEKAARLFAALRPRRYVAVDISVDFLRESLEVLQARHPQLPMLGLGLDLERPPALPPQAGDGSRLMFYPGSSIGNFSPSAAVVFLRRLREVACGGPLLIGVDLLKPAPDLQRAYDDALGVTAAFNLNLLRHVNRLLSADFEPAQWRHVALFDAAQSRVEMHLEALCDLVVQWPGARRAFQQGERLLTEIACKYDRPGFDTLLREAGYAHTRCWTDARGSFAVFVAR